jgi:hypothetical protein
VDFNGFIETLVINNSSKYSINSIITFQCSANMTLRGSRISKCQINGSWLPNIPKCESLFFILHLINSSYLSLDPISCSIPALPRNAHYSHLRPFIQKINDGSHLEYICDNSHHRHRIICRRGKIFPRMPMCYNGIIYLNKTKNLVLYFIFRLSS